jgi:transposase
MNVQDFFKQFPDDDSCLVHLMKVRFGDLTKCPSCKGESKFHKLKDQPCYSCQMCGHHIHPMVDTPFMDSHTPLQKWFYAMYLFTTSRHGVPAKELQRQLSVTYKTAWRMAHQIRKYMGYVDGDDKLNGDVEADETFIGGKKEHLGKHYIANKSIVFGMVQRKGNVMTKVVPNTRKTTLTPIIEKNVYKLSRIHTDESQSYALVAHKGYIHDTVNHSKKEYVRGLAHTNSIEGFWSQVKRSIKGTHVHVSRKHLQKYLVEFEFRYNLRQTPWLMFDRLLKAF